MVTYKNLDVGTAPQPLASEDKSEALEAFKKGRKQHSGLFGGRPWFGGLRKATYDYQDAAVDHLQGKTAGAKEWEYEKKPGRASILKTLSAKKRSKASMGVGVEGGSGSVMDRGYA